MKRLLSLTLFIGAISAEAATSPIASSSPLGGNGHNISGDGRLFVIRRNAGWEAVLLRPQGVTVSAGIPNVTNAFSNSPLVQLDQHTENALALCEATPQPIKCDSNGAANPAGVYSCYQEVVIDSDALAPAPNDIMRRRVLQVIVSNPNSATANIDSFTWIDSSLTPLSPVLRGLEATVTKDGKLLVWQGHPNNTGAIDTLVYSYNPSPCALSGWSAPKSITAMATDANLIGKYKLAERQLRGADGVAFTNGQIFNGAYPWIFPSGEAINFTATNMPCRSAGPPEDPPGCGPRRNALSVIGYPTNWQLAHIDGAVNPDTDQTVRLFFTSPGPMNATPLPATAGVDVWPFFGSNTSNYTELVFDDGLDGRYGGLWHFNELVNNTGSFDLTRTGDSSGYSNTGKLMGGASFPTKNNGALGKAIIFDGASGRVEVVHAASLNPVNAITVELQMKTAADPNCDANNNYRNVLSKGQSYSLILEDDREIHGRVRVTGGVVYELLSTVPVSIGAWNHVAFQYDAASGTLVFRINGVETARVVKPPALLEGTTDKLTIGAPGARAACPNGDGAFNGELDEVGVSRIWRYGTPPVVVVPDAGVPVVDAGTPVVDAGTPVVDAGVADGGVVKPPDAGIPPVVDAGTVTMPPDSGTPPVMTADAGVVVTPPHPDAGTTVHETTEAAGGCSASGGALALGALALVVSRRRRRRS